MIDESTTSNDLKEVVEGHSTTGEDLRMHVLFGWGVRGMYLDRVDHFIEDYVHSIST